MLNGYCNSDCTLGGILNQPNDSTRTCEYGACHPQCFKCKGSTKDDCTACDIASSRPYLLGSNCVSSCPDGYYPNLT